jgi:flagellar biosynthesis protein FlhF
MQLKSVIGESLPEALVKAKQMYGEDIILLETKEVKGKTGRKLVEVKISVDGDEQVIKAWTPPKISVPRELAPPGKNLPRETAEPKARPGNNDFSKAIAEILNRKTQESSQEKKILDEIASLRQELSQLSQAKEKQTDTLLPQFYMETRAHLQDKGVSERLSDSFVKRVYRLLASEKKVSDKDIIDGVKLEMNRMFQPFSFKNGAQAEGQQVILLLGSTGVGKSTTAMKLAAHPDLLGKKDVVIISTDQYGPTEALKAFSRMNGTQIHEARNGDEIKEAMQRFASKDVVIIDTPGQSPFQPNYLSKLEEYVKAFHPTDIFLVLSLNTDLKDLFMSCALYLLLKPSGVVFTKFDETSQPGKVFSILDELELPVVCYGEGKRIFIDVIPPDIEYIFNKLFEAA